MFEVAGCYLQSLEVQRRKVLGQQCYRRHEEAIRTLTEYIDKLARLGLLWYHEQVMETIDSLILDKSSL